jgi:hypothetical protein
VRRIARCVTKAPVFCWHFKLKEPTQITGYSESDWAGDERTRKSTSGGVIVLESADHVKEEMTVAAVNAWSRAQ